MNSLTGLIVCGGKSSRMGQDKSLISYHSIPQWQYLTNLLEPHCSRVVISCNASQAKQFKTGSAVLVDDARFADCGPMAAVLTAFRAYPSSPLLVIGCDYPLVTTEDLKNLAAARKEETDAVCLYHEVAQIEEPLVAVYEPSIYPVLIGSFKSADFSLRKVLIRGRTERIPPATLTSLATADTPEQSKTILEVIQNSVREV